MKIPSFRKIILALLAITVTGIAAGIYIFHLLGSLPSNDKFLDQASFTRLINSLNLIDKSVEDATQTLTDMDFKCYQHKSNNLCTRELPGFLCNQIQSVDIAIKQPSNKIDHIKPILQSACL